ncbi:MAG: dTDP-4-dehydrorhamnose reductase [Ignavibacteriales bacterium]|nr:dTDP-4-dehydrorhamnose reductase [Ignavibacteriales bacterium]
MKVAVIGANGQLGTEIVKGFSDETVIALTQSDIEISEIGSVEKAFANVSPDLVVNTASLVNVELCEKEPAKAFLINETGALNLARVLEERKIPLLHISTDYVFDGTKRSPYDESDDAKPLNVYGASKLAGERAIQAVCSRHFIVRTSGLYGHAQCMGKGANFIEKILARSKEKSELQVVDDEVLTPTYTLDLAKQIRVLTRTGEFGLYHATNNGECSWFEFAKEALRLAGSSTRVVPVSSAIYPSELKRPAYSVLANARLIAQGLDQMPAWQESLKAYFEYLTS